MHWVISLSKIRIFPIFTPTKPHIMSLFDRHWTEYLNNDDESNDRDDDWEWERQDDFGDPWDHEDPPSD